LGIIRNSDGYDMPYSKMEYHINARNLNFPIVKKYNGVYDIKELKARNILNKEGYVLRYENGFRMKVKFEDYCRLHSIITNVSTKDIWMCLRDGKDLNELLDRTPDEFDEWVRGQVELLKDAFAEVEDYAILDFDGRFEEGISKKDFALKAMTSNYSSILFKMFDKKPYDHIIWKLIEPEFSKPFWNKTGDEE
jgi:RNA ligase